MRPRSPATARSAPPRPLALLLDTRIRPQFGHLGPQKSALELQVIFRQNLLGRNKIPWGCNDGCACASASSQTSPLVPNQSRLGGP